MKTLFTYSANKQCSKTAEDYFAEKYPEYIFKSAGTNLKICRKEGTTKLPEDLLLIFIKLCIEKTQSIR